MIGPRPRHRPHHAGYLIGIKLLCAARESGGWEVRLSGTRAIASGEMAEHITSGARHVLELEGNSLGDGASAEANQHGKQISSLNNTKTCMGGV